jgi:eukaryotic-like serine/threonine-protein kinase
VQALTFLGKYEEAHHVISESEARVQRLGSAGEATATLLFTESQLLSAESRYPEAIDRALRSLTIREHVLLPGDANIALTRVEIADSLVSLGHFPAGTLLYRLSIIELTRTFGSESRELIGPWTNLATALRHQGRTQEALVAYREAARLCENNLSVEHSGYGSILLGLGELLAEQGKPDEALAEYGKAEAVFVRRLGAQHPNVGTIKYLEGRLLLERGRPVDALAALQQAETIWSASLGAGDATTAVARIAIADATREGGNPRASLTLYGIGLAELQLGSPQLAAPRFERAITVLLKSNAEPRMLADCRFGLARTLRKLGKNAVRATQLAGDARGFYASSPATADAVASVDRWLTAGR